MRGMNLVHEKGKRVKLEGLLPLSESVGVLKRRAKAVETVRD
jgi:hypothetical protein